MATNPKADDPADDPVNPKHYTELAIQPIEVIEEGNS